MTFDLETFRRDGLQVVKGFFEPHMRERFEALGQDIVAKVQTGQAGRNQQFLDGLDVDAAAQVSDSGALHGVAKTILGADVAWLVSRVLMKDHTFKGAIQVHQDWPYFGGDTRKLNVFVPLTRCRRQNGMLVFYKGSHTLGPVERGEIDIDRFPEFEPVCPELDVGDVLFADFLSWHSSVDAETPDDRILLQVVLQPLSDRSSNNIFGIGRRDMGRVVEERFAPMLAPTPSVSVAMALSFFNSGRSDDAFRMASGIARNSPNDVEALLLLERIATERGEPSSHYRLQATQALERLAGQLGRRLEEEPGSSFVTSAQVEELTRDIERIRSSTSWKVTAPLRWIKDRAS